MFLARKMMYENDEERCMDVYKKTREALITPCKRSAVWGLKQKNMKSYLKFLSRNKLYTAVEAVGLVVSLAFVILIGSYVTQNLAVVNENPAHDRIYGLGNTLHLGLSVWIKSLWKPIFLKLS